MADNDENKPLQQQISGGSYGSAGDKDKDNDKKPKKDIKIKYDDSLVDNRVTYMDKTKTKNKSMFSIIAFSLQIILIVLYAVAVEYETPLTNPQNEDVSDYVYFQQVNVMMFIGFGYLMTFLRRYGFGAITFNMMLTVLCIQWGMFMVGLIDVLFTRTTHKLNLGIDNLAQGDIAAAVILISFGAV